MKGATIAVAQPEKRRKYRNQPCEVDGHKFDSKKEGARYLKLRMLESCGMIQAGSLSIHPRWNLVVNGVHVGTYEADFSYVLRDGGFVVEDVKGYRKKSDPAYRLFLVKKALMVALWNIAVVEV